MARRRPKPATPADRPESRELAARIQDAKRRGYTNKQIGEAFGMNERTVRRIRSGETPGTRIYKERVQAAPRGSSPSIVRMDLLMGVDENGNEVVRTVNAKVPAMRTAKGMRRAPTPFDVFRLPDLASVATAEAKRLGREYGNLVARFAAPGTISSIRPIARRNPDKRLVTVRGAYR